MLQRQYKELMDYSDPPPPLSEADEAPLRAFELHEISLDAAEKAAFSTAFDGKSWDMLLLQKKLMTAAQVLEACPNMDDESMYQIHKESEVVLKVRKGLYVTRFDELPKKSERKAPLYVVNAFTASLR